MTFGSTERVDYDGVSAVTRCIVRVGWTDTEDIQVENYDLWDERGCEKERFCCVLSTVLCKKW